MASPTEVHPELAAATRVQLSAWREALDAGAVRVGWKLAYGIPEIEALSGDAPAIGHLTSATLLESGGRHHADGARALRAETEIAIVLAHDVAPDADEQTAQAAIGALQVALELVDVGRPPDDVDGIVANNVLHRAASLGPTTNDTDLRDAVARAIVNGELRDTAPIRRDHGASVRAVARVLAAAERALVTACAIVIPRLGPMQSSVQRRYLRRRRRQGAPRGGAPHAGRGARGLQRRSSRLPHRLGQR